MPPTVNTNPPRPILVFDGDCGFCTSSARWLHRWVVSGGSTHLAPWQQLDLADLRLTAEQCLAAVQWVGPDGSVLAGHLAIAASLRAGRPVWRPVGALLVVPGVSWLAKRAYTWIAAHRYALPGGTPACKVNDGPNRPT